MNTLSPNATTGSPAGGASPFNEWALVEIMGHQRIVGKVSEQVIAGSAFLRVDVPEIQGKPGFTRFYSPGAVYAISPITEQTAMGMLPGVDAEPVRRFDIVKQIASGPVQPGLPIEDGEEDDCPV